MYQVNFISVSASNTTEAFISTVLKKALMAELKISPKIFFIIAW